MTLIALRRRPTVLASPILTRKGGEARRCGEIDGASNGASCRSELGGSRRDYRGELRASDRGLDVSVACGVDPGGVAGAAGARLGCARGELIVDDAASCFRLLCAFLRE